MNLYKWQPKYMAAIFFINAFTINVFNNWIIFSGIGAILYCIYQENNALDFQINLCVILITQGVYQIIFAFQLNE